MSLRDEILEQPEALRRQLADEDGAAVLAAVADVIRARGIESVVIAARGTSDHAAIYAQYILGVRNRLSVALAAPAVLSLYGVEPRFGRSLVIGVSQSGASPDIVGVVEAARLQGAATLAITNEPASPLAAAAEHVLELHAGPERAVAATKTYTASLLAVARLSLAIDGEGTAALDIVTLAVEAALAVEPEVAAIAGELAAGDRCVVLGRGFEYATAREWALKLKELATIFADPYSAADFRHGPIALLEPGVPVLALAPSGRPAAGMVALLTELRDRGLDLVVASDVAAIRALGRRSIALPPDVPEWLRPIVSIVPAQLHALHLTLARGLDPETPRAIQKVTRTV